MQVQDLSGLAPDRPIDTDLAIIGGGPAGLTIARSFFGTSTRVLVLESGLQREEQRFADLNAVESIGEPKGAAQLRKRSKSHSQAASWSGDSQAYGVRCRSLGGSSIAWAGKVAPFDPLDFAPRSWVPYSGWPFGLETLEPYLDRAADVLNLGPGCYDEQLWEFLERPAPQPSLDASRLRSFFWQFARSKINKSDIMRFGAEFLTYDAPNVRVLLNATVTHIDTNEAGTKFEGLEISAIGGTRACVRAKVAVLASGGIENPRLLLNSNRVHSNGLGNQNDVVGRFLMDHPSAELGHFEAEHWPFVTRRFGFYGVKARGHSHLYMHGLAPSAELQREDRLLNCAAFVMPEYAPDDPWEAIHRLLHRKSDTPASDLLAIVASPVLVAKGVGMRIFNSTANPQWVKTLIVDAMIERFPNFVVQEFQSRGLPRKFKGVRIDGITEQRPNPESRITLSSNCDALGMPMARVDWRVDYDARRSLIRLGNLLAAEFQRAGLPAPVLEEWVAHNQPNDGVIIDMGHTAGTTRMSDDPKLGVVDSQSQVHGIEGLYVTGASVFPTSGHANPTLMILAVAIRVADRIKAVLAL